MIFFKCKHPFDMLAVEKEQTTEVIDDDFIHITYHLRCKICGDLLKLKHAKLIHGAKEYLGDN